jgi:hypothetical protein
MSRELFAVARVRESGFPGSMEFIRMRVNASLVDLSLASAEARGAGR